MSTNETKPAALVKTDLARVDLIKATNEHVAGLMDGLEYSTADRLDTTREIIAELPNVSTDAARSLAKRAAADKVAVNFGADLLEASAAETEVEKILRQTAADKRRKAWQDYCRRASVYFGGDLTKATQSAGNVVKRAILLREFCNDDCTIPVGILEKYFAQWVKLDSTDASFRLERPKYNVDGLRIPKSAERVSALDLASIRDAYKASIGKRGGCDQQAFRKALGELGYAAPVAEKETKAPQTNEEIDALFWRLAETADQPTARSAADIAVQFDRLALTGGISAGEALQTVGAILKSFAKAFAPAVDAGGTAAADLADKIIGRAGTLAAVKAADLPPVSVDDAADDTADDAAELAQA